MSLAPGVVVGALYLVAWLGERDAPQGYGQGGLIAVVGASVTGSLLVAAVVGWPFRAGRERRGGPGTASGSGSPPAQP